MPPSCWRDGLVRRTIHRQPPAARSSLQVSSAGGSTTILVASTSLRLTHAAGATVQTATLGPLGPMT